MSATAQMCAHCAVAAQTVRATRAENERLRKENEFFRKQVHEFKLEKLREERKPQRRVEKRTGLELADHLEFASGLEVKDLGFGRWMAQCPAHDERTGSLSIRECEDGAVLIHCFGGCLTEDVLGAIGWEFGMLRPN